MRPSTLALSGLLALASISLLFTIGCTAVDDDDDGGAFAFVGDLFPQPGQSDFFGGDTIWVQFALAVPPTEVTLSLADAAGTPVAAEQTADELRYYLQPDAMLAPSTSYTLTIDFQPREGDPSVIGFSTGPWGEVLGSGAEDLVDVTFRFDLESGTWHKPEGVGSLIAGLLGEYGLAFALTDASAFEPADQPGVHINGALIAQEGDSWVQDACTPTLPYTYGPDGEAGTGDDFRATWDDPWLTFGPGDLELVVTDIEASIKDFHLNGVVHPGLDDLRGLELQGSADTRALDSQVGEDAEEGAVCGLVKEVADIDCIECGEPPGEFCLELHITDLTAVAVPEVVIETMDCADIIQDHLDSGGTSCAEDVADYDPAGDGSYTDCPTWVAR